MTPQDPISLAGWRRNVAETYAAVRQLAPTDPDHAWRTFRTARDTLFRTHLQTPLTIDPADFAVFLAHRDAIVRALRELGYDDVTLDLLGYRSGSLNEARR